MRSMKAAMASVCMLLPMALLATACAQQPAPPPAAHLPKLNGPLEVAKGDPLTITLDANPTTGFQWQLAQPLDEKVLKLVTHAFQRPATSGVGAGGTDVWTFKAIGAGSTAIVLEYRRPWEKDVPAAERKTFPVVVR
jgi:inhibitor of cysteine peptidase